MHVCMGAISRSLSTYWCMYNNYVYYVHSSLYIGLRFTQLCARGSAFASLVLTYVYVFLLYFERYREGPYMKVQCHAVPAQHQIMLHILLMHCRAGVVLCLLKLHVNIYPFYLSPFIYALTRAVHKISIL